MFLFGFPVEKHRVNIITRFIEGMCNSIERHGQLITAFRCRYGDCAGLSPGPGPLLP